MSTSLRLLLLVILSCPASAPAATLYVDASHPGCPGSGTPADPYCRIQTAIDAASSGDTILVAPGTYFENPRISGKVLTIRSTAGPEVTVIDGGRLASVVSFAAGADTTLEGFTITQGAANTGAGIHCLDSAPTIVGNTIHQNSGLFGGGIYVSPSSAPAIESNTIFYNNSFYGGGIDCHGPAAIVGNVLFGNSATDGGGLRLNADAPVLVNNTITENIGSNGAGLHVSGGTPLLVNDILWGDVLGGEVVVTGGTPTLAYCDVEGGHPGTGNFSADPLFLDPLANDYRIACHSPCTDSGATGGIPLLPFDHSGQDLRLIGPIDVGADEAGIAWELRGSPTPGGAPVHFELRGPPSHPVPQVTEVYLSLGDGSGSGGLPRPGSGGRRIGLAADGLLTLWLGLAPPLRQASPITCGGAQTVPFGVPAGAPVGLNVYQAGVSWDLANGTAVSISDTDIFQLQ